MANSTSNGLSTLGVTQVVFIILAAADLIHWPVIWIFVPLWGVMLTMVVVVCVGYVVGGITTGIENRLRLRRMYRFHLLLKGRKP